LPKSAERSRIHVPSRKDGIFNENCNLI
jgi:hypothetical protein